MDRRPAPPSSNKNSSRPHCRKLLLRGSPIGRPETVHDGTPRAAGPIVPLHPRGVPKLGIRPQQRPAAAQPSCRAGMAAIRFLHQGHSVPSVSDGRSSAPVRRRNAGTLTCSFHTPRSFRSNMFHFGQKRRGSAPVVRLRRCPLNSPIRRSGVTRCAGGPGKARQGLPFQ